jgi:CubicO group peptidase (beta-lactamase class C family)
MAERLLEPLGMDDTGFHVPADSLDRLTTMYGSDDDGGLRVRDEPTGFFTRPPDFPSGSGGLVEDLMKAFWTYAATVA